MDIGGKKTRERSCFFFPSLFGCVSGFLLAFFLSSFTFTSYCFSPSPFYFSSALFVYNPPILSFHFFCVYFAVVSCFVITIMDYSGLAVRIFPERDERKNTPTLFTIGSFGPPRLIVSFAFCHVGDVGDVE